MTRRSYRAALAAALLSLLTAACSANAVPATHAAARTAPTTNVSPKDAKLEAAWTDFQAAANKPKAHRLSTGSGLAGTKDFTAADVAVYANLARLLMLRSVDPKLNQMAPEQAFDYVMEVTVNGSRTSERKSLAKDADGTDWHHIVANQFPKGATISRPEFIDVKWDHGQNMLSTARGRLPNLWVALQTHVRTQVTLHGVTRPIVVLRTIVVRGFQPTGSADAWPGIAFYTYPFGNDGCEFLRDHPALVPSKVTAGIKGDAQALKKTLSNKQLYYYEFQVTAHAKKKWAATCAKQARQQS